MERFPKESTTYRVPDGMSRRDPRRPLTTLLIVMVITTLCLSALISIGILLFGDFGETEGRVLLSAMALAGYSLAALVLSVRVGRNPVWLGPVGIGFSAIGFLLAIVLIWIDGDVKLLEKLTFSVLVLVAAFAHAAILLPRHEHDTEGSMLLRCTFVATAILTAMIIVPILFSTDFGEFYFRVIGVIAVLATLGTLVAPILRRGERAREPVSVVAASPFANDNLQDGELRMTYNHESIVIRVLDRELAEAGFDVDAWIERDGVRAPVTFSQALDGLNDRHEVLAAAVQMIARSIDDGSFRG